MEDDDKSIPKLPITGKRNILITNALPCVNNVTHPGNIIGCVLSADVYARYCRLRGYNVLHICGTDDYETATDTKALEENHTSQEICDKYHAIQKEVYDWFDISFDMFGRTSTPEHTQVCQAIFNKLWRNMRLLDRDTDPQVIELPDLKDKLEKYINKTSESGFRSQNAIETTNAGLEKGLDNISITRDLKWRVPVPNEKYEDKLFCDWFDIPIGYISITSCYTSEWEKWWKNPENVELYQFMGTDRVPSHTVMLPSLQLGTRENWTLMKTISLTGYLNYEGGNFSKSKKCAGVFDTNIPADVWRYYLLIDLPEVSDTSSFEWTDLQAKRNNKFLRKLGYFVDRVLCIIANPQCGYGSVILDAPGAESHRPTMSLGKNVGKLVNKYVQAMEKVKLKEGLKIAMEILVQGNRYFEGSQFWKLYEEDEPNCAVVIRTAAGLTHLLAKLFEPFMPSFSREVFKQLNLPQEFSLCDERGKVLQASRPWKILPSSHRIGTPEPLFKELKQSDKGVKQFENKFYESPSDKLATARRRARKQAARTRRRDNAEARFLEEIRREAREASSDKDAWDRRMARMDAYRLKEHQKQQLLESKECRDYDCTCSMHL